MTEWLPWLVLVVLLAKDALVLAVLSRLLVQVRAQQPVVKPATPPSGPAGWVPRG